MAKKDFKTFQKKENKNKEVKKDVVKENKETEGRKEIKQVLCRKDKVEVLKKLGWKEIKSEGDLILMEKEI